jgi:nucleoside-diphosphate-sugar epimerase
MLAFINLRVDSGERIGGKNMVNPILVTGAAGRVGAVARTVTELLLKQGKTVRAMVRHEDQRARRRCATWVRRS